MTFGRLVKCCSYLSLLSLLPASLNLLKSSALEAPAKCEQRHAESIWGHHGDDAESQTQVGLRSGRREMPWERCQLQVRTLGSPECGHLGSTALLMGKAKENANTGCWDVFNHPFVQKDCMPTVSLTLCQAWGLWWKMQRRDEDSALMQLIT